MYVKSYSQNIFTAFLKKLDTILWEIGKQFEKKLKVFHLKGLYGDDIS